jgi:hypothetical protein
LNRKNTIFFFLIINGKIKMCEWSFEDRFNQVLKKLPLSIVQTQIIRARYLTIVSSTQATYRITAFTYNLFIWIITLGSVSTAITSAIGQGTVGNASQSAQTTAYFWIGVALPLLVALANKWLYIFNVHQKYLVSENMLSKLYAEGWSFAAATGIYQPGDYTAKFNIFCKQVESIQALNTSEMISIQNTDGQTAPSTQSTVKNNN